ncbi:molybdopterin molybdochelatase [Brevibacterium iodinum ATCC 49514]|uniref:Molybdopterin molybdenumtransferase n=1 Tax=Brevibacterium iodinum ATCC 49514 TaxID=1255616 RepID=A0A2H1JUB6_9MICO|nr:molybdopterin molybdotransferase MoeA [Brevibacterium iodinum]SMX91090.1 molybdopterin molybdochelatase [Brevibacterium iodinum ATCC 49514]SUW12391.1 Molybdopterin molybdenumtransferase [Brevibacterium iodinum]
MTTAKMHRERVSEIISPLTGPVSLPLSSLLEAPRRLTADVESPIDVPGFDNSSMDGYALAAATAEEMGGSPIPVGGRVAAGARGETVQPGTAVEIMTGAPLPQGTDMVVKIEDTAAGRFGAESITLDAGAEPRPGAFVRPRGSDVTAGQTVLSAGTMLTPAHLGVAAACGVNELPVLGLPRVLIVSTGDEIAAEAAAGINDANSVTLSSGLRRLGVDTEVAFVPDDPQQLLDRVRDSDAQLVISTGGISKGAHEVVRLAADLDADSSMTFEPIAMQPGGPQGCGRLADHAWVALPGNPVSTLISFELFIRPALLGLPDHEAPREVAHHRLAHGFDEAPPAGKLQVRRARLTEAGLEFVGDSRSHLLHSYAEASHLVFVSPEDAGAGDPFSAVGDRLMTWKIA